MTAVPTSLQLEPNARRAALERCYDQLKRWRVALPPGEPLVIDFGLGQFNRFGLFEFWIANECQAGYCGKYMFVLDGQTCPRHSHRVKHETFFVVRGKLSITLEDQELTLDEGMTLAIEPGKAHSFTGVGPALMLELSMPCDPRDNVFEAPETMEWLRTNVG
jgi:D-lyxose ketol-isomerase